MEQVQYTSSEHNAADISDTSDNSNNNTIADSSTPNGNSSMRIISSMMQYRKQSGSNGSMEADAYIDKSRNELKLLRCNAFHRSRTLGGTRRIIDSSLRMRPYFIPERSRTKSENSVELDAHATTMDYGALIANGTPAANNVCIDGMSSNSNSMMDTCDAYSNSECVNASSSCGFLLVPTNNSSSFAAANGGQAMSHMPPALNSNQYFRPIKCAAVTQMKKSKSLESVRVENINGSQPSHEMEFVSTRFAAKFKLN